MIYKVTNQRVSQMLGIYRHAIAARYSSPVAIIMYPVWSIGATTSSHLCVIALLENEDPVGHFCELLIQVLHT